MKLIDNILKKLSTSVAENLKKEIVTDYYNYSPNYQPTRPIPFDGEKTPGELGRPINYYPHYYNLRVRSWEAYLNNEIPQIVVNKYVLWVVGQGLKLQAEPKTSLLPSNFNDEEFKDKIETRFRLYADDKESTWPKTLTLNQLAAEAKKNAVVGGDVLLVQHFEKNKISAELIDGAHIATPYGSIFIKEASERKNKIIHGVEINSKGQHINYYVKDSVLGYKKIPAKGQKSGRVVATMIYGLRYRLNETRGIPLMTAIAETVKKLDRYKEAAVGSAEERAKIVFVQTHEINSSGANVLRKPVINASNVNAGKAPETNVDNENATTIATTTGKSTFNLTPGSDLKALASQSEADFEKFFTPNANLVASCMGIPAAVAFDNYDRAFNSAQAAVKSWGHKLFVEQKNFGIDFYQPIYEFWLYVNDLIGYINIPGFQKALEGEDRAVILAYYNARWVGPRVPQIDPLKEVKSEIGMINAGLTTLEGSAERLGLGDWSKNIEQYKKELKKLPVIEPVIEQNINKNGETT